jgi:hypothetical protein
MSEKMESIIAWKVAGELHIPKDWKINTTSTPDLARKMSIGNQGLINPQND